VIDQLAERGLLARVRRNRDRRKVELKLTKRGRAAIDGLIPIVVAKQNTVLMDFGVAEMHEFQRLLVKLDDKLSTIIRG
jgi:DNA-binding MarR family transcriptional regulator